MSLSPNFGQLEPNARVRHFDAYKSNQLSKRSCLNSVARLLKVVVGGI